MRRCHLRPWFSLGASIIALLSGCGDDDASPPPFADSGVIPDAGSPDADTTDPGTTDAAAPDSGTPDDAGVPEDAGPDAALPAPDRLGLQLVTDGLVSPVLVRDFPDSSGRALVVDQIGVVYLLDEDDERLTTPFLDLRDQLVELQPAFDERGLLGLAFHPEFEDNGRLFVYYSTPLTDEGPDDYDHTARISEFVLGSSDDDEAPLESERVILEVHQPQANHNGGHLEFGPDGYLYIGLGDGGGANDVGLGHPDGGNGQDRDTLLGSVLRIDVDSDEPYAIPSDNPFVGEDGREEIYAYGFRNPYRFSFDRNDGTLLVADVGQNRWEEVSAVEAGGNYGWRIREGAHCFDPDNPNDEPMSCPSESADGEPLRDPVLEYLNANAMDGIGLAIVGGYMYRGNNLQRLRGHYVFADYSESPSMPLGNLFVATPTPNEMWPWKALELAAYPQGRINAFVRGLSEDAQGELYLLVSDDPGPTGTSGRVYRIVSASEGEPPDEGPESDAGADAGVSDAASPETDAGDAWAEQVAFGLATYAANCAQCHGADGSGLTAPPLVGDDALPLEPPDDRAERTEDFVTALDVYDFASENMPLGNPGSLEDEQYLAIVAFVLEQNGVTLDEPLSEDNADEVVINPE